MKKVTLLALFSLITLGVRADLSEDFNSLSSGSWSAETNVDLPSGTWSFGGGAQYNKSNNVIAIKFNAAGAYMISPAMDSLATIEFKYRSGGSNKKVEIAYQIGSEGWQVLDTLSIPSSSSSFSTYSHAIPADSSLNVRVRIKGLASSIFIDDVLLKNPVQGQGQGGGTVVPGEPDPEFTRPEYVATHATYYISPEGNDESGNGSFENPWYNLGKAISVAQAGDVIYCRGGRYMMSWRGTDGKLTVRLSQSGTAAEPIVISAYENEAPIFDFEQQLLDCNRNKNNVGDRGMLITGNYWILFGLHLMHAADNAIKLEGSHNRIERCEFSYNLDTGIQLGFGHKFSDSFPGISKNDGSYCAYNDIVDCDSHHNCDFDANYGSDADGFACKMHNGIGNRFIRCRAWRNSDDAWDLFETDYDVILAECWAWESGNASDHLWVKQYFDGSASFSGNGNGIKLGGNGTGGSSQGIHYAYRCVAFGCDISSSVKGFDCNSHKGGHVLINCLAFDNSYDYMFESGGSDANTYYYNNVCFGRQEISVGTDDYNALATSHSKLAWTNHLVTSFSRSDYVSLSEADAIAPRRGDGSMPSRFARLLPGSNLVDAGCEVPSSVTPNLAQLLADFPFLDVNVSGVARDLGPYELLQANDTTESLAQVIVNPEKNGSIDVIAGNSANERIVRFSVPNNVLDAELTLFDISGRMIQRIPLSHLSYGAEYYQPLEMPEGNGLYVVRLTAGAYSVSAKFTR
jgi:hypothetical protein